MMKGRYLLLLAGLIAFVVPVVVQAEGFLTPKQSWIKWNDTHFVYGDNRLIFYDSYNPTFAGLEFTFRFNNNLAVGGEFIFYDIDVSSNTSISTGLPAFLNGYANVYHYNAFAKYFLSNSKNYMPYVGVGLGKAKISIHSVPNVIMHGPAYFANAGIIVRMTSLLGISLEYKKAYIDVEDIYGSRLNTHTDFLQLGLTFIL